MEDKRGWIFWVPRILSIAFILFLALFSLDVFEPGLSAGEIALGLFMHNIPSLILLFIVILSWKREIVGGIAFLAVGALYVFLVFFRASVPPLTALTWSLIISGPAFLIGILYLAGWIRKKRLRQT
ncbi:DUF7670 domain-containing protein [Papillibacter cinnamivorans]|uniref:DUF7670 domain-containing protein n=1 Tax=Papillibacter cinnamivorans DSM 12816 TaxID=1122930 RepID=A0A1W1ZQE2_9FIRM|nr:hypothetical protein [Papillibacter cinnamivorans]SMC50639.1 hypothetical protein SAMN02745168_1293 [Papillibacter cinnamivorans DSM 12816]